MILETMVAIVAGAEGSTAGPLTRMLDQRGIPRGILGGKTGTSEYDAKVRDAAGGLREVTIRTSSFVGFAPAVAPRYLVVCVLQKEGAAAFYGGRYAAPAAGRLLLTALSRAGDADQPAGGRRSVRAPGGRSGVDPR